MTQGVVSMSARQGASRKTSSKSFLIVSAASALPGSTPIAAGQETVMLSPEVAAKVNAHNNLQGAVPVVNHFGPSFPTKRVGGFNSGDLSKIRRTRQFLRQSQSEVGRERARAVAFMNTRLPLVLQKFNAQLDALVTGDAFRKAYLIDKTRATKIHTALGEARANIVKQEQPLLTKMSTFSWTSHAELWDKELQETNRKTEQLTTTATSTATPYVFGQPNLVGALVNPVTTSEKEWKQATTKFLSTLNGFAKINVKSGKKLIGTLPKDEKRKLQTIPKRRFRAQCNGIIGGFMRGKVPKDSFMKWVNGHLANKTKAEGEVDQLMASLGIMKSYFQALNPNNTHVVAAMTKAGVHEEVYKSVLRDISKEMEATLRVEGPMLQNLVKDSISPALANQSDLYTKLVAVVNKAYNAGVGTNARKTENSLEAMILSSPKDFYKNLAAKRFNFNKITSRVENGEGEVNPQPLENKEQYKSIFIGTALMHDKQLTADAEAEADSGYDSDDGFSSALASEVTVKA